MHFTAGGSRTNKPEALSFTDKVRVLLFGVEIPQPVSNKTYLDLAPTDQLLFIPLSNKKKLDGSRVANAWLSARGL